MQHAHRLEVEAERGRAGRDVQTSKKGTWARSTGADSKQVVDFGRPQKLSPRPLRPHFAHVLTAPTPAHDPQASSRAPCLRVSACRGPRGARARRRGVRGGAGPCTRLGAHAHARSRPARSKHALPDPSRARRPAGQGRRRGRQGEGRCATMCMGCACAGRVSSHALPLTPCHSTKFAAGIMADPAA